MAKRQLQIPGFTSLSDRILFNKAETTTQADDQPDLIILFAWGDSIPKHVAKYTEGFRETFPQADQVVVFSAILDVLYTNTKQRSEDLKPLIELLEKRSDSTATKEKTPRTLIHCMSNTGGISYAFLLQEFRQLSGKILPHDLTVFDSTPGSTNMTWFNLQRWSKAMALGTAAWFPWPFFVTQSIWGTFLCTLHGAEWLIGRQSNASVSTKVMNDTSFESSTARKLYLYGKDDDLIFWKDIEEHAAVARQAGYAVDSEIFSGSGHVSHMRASPERYWSAIKESWSRALEV